ncbi:hypothetical protein [Amycolatopsis silviterrae]|uniref:DUF4232 domain-containing protein n=1 Tax=Amycolatopsis silviterrae TaxID=1656914 RepID=A0ABW5H1K0_9PSEU
MIALRRTLAATAALAIAGGAAALTATAANASPAETPFCTDADVTVTATPATDHAAGHHADVLHYSAATPNTHCTLSGAPYNTVFYDNANAPLGVPTTSDSSEGAPVIPTTTEPGPNSVKALEMHLPSDASRTPIGVYWPGNDLTTSAHFSVITQD